MVIFVKYFALAAFLIVFLTDLYFAVIAVGYKKKYCSKCKGYLTNTTQRKNVYIGGKNGRFYKHYLNFKYTYRVNGKVYEISDGVPGTKNNINSAVDIIYQKRNPKFAYIHNLTIPFEPIITFLLIPVWILLLICAIGL